MEKLPEWQSWNLEQLNVSYAPAYALFFCLWCLITKASAPWKTQTGLTIPPSKTTAGQLGPRAKTKYLWESQSQLVVCVVVPRQNEIDLATKSSQNCFSRLRRYFKEYIPLPAAVERTPRATYAPVPARSELGHQTYTSCVDFPADYYGHLLSSPWSRPYNESQVG